MTMIRIMYVERESAWSAEQLAWLDAKGDRPFAATRGDDGYWRADGEPDAPVILVDDEIVECTIGVDCAGCNDGPLTLTGPQNPPQTGE